MALKPSMKFSACIPRHFEVYGDFLRTLRLFSLAKHIILGGVLSFWASLINFDVLSCSICSGAEFCMKRPCVPCHPAPYGCFSPPRMTGLRQHALCWALMPPNCSSSRLYHHVGRFIVRSGRNFMLQSSAGSQDRHRVLVSRSHARALCCFCCVFHGLFHGTTGALSKPRRWLLAYEIGQDRWYREIIQDGATVDHACHVVITLDVHETRSSPRPNDLPRAWAVVFPR
jgi:hypothetical protein